MRVSVEFTCKYRVNFAPHYVFTIKPVLLINLKTGRIINQIMKSGSIGYVIEGKFYSLTRLREDLELILKKELLPF